ncbi:MAG: adenosylmethionine decarboxylase [Candidatus Marsarchaeota archaeon]|nr:adenosylmethionine decarboxylase [Candidatus Marsarchaeota archaeon]
METGGSSTRGIHLLAELYGCDRDATSDLETVRRAMRKAAHASGSSVVSEHFIPLHPGVTGVIVVMESHLSVHTWPESGYASVDVYTCGLKRDPEASLLVIRDAFNPKYIQTMTVERGVRGGLRQLSEARPKV